MNRTLMREAPAWMMSLIINLTALGALHFVVMYKPVSINETIIDSTVDTLDTTEEAVDFISISGDSVGQREGGDPNRIGDGGGGGTGNLGAMVATNSQAHSKVNSGAAAGFDSRMTGFDIASNVVLAPVGESGTGLVAVNSKGSIDSAKGGTPGIMDRLTFEIEQSCRERPTLVLWIFDASGSLRERRNAIAERFDVVYNQLTKQTKEGILHTAAMHFGEKYTFMTDQPVTDVTSLVEDVKKIPEDKSGLENVFAAVHAGVQKYKNFGKGQGRYNKLVIIITDERGDDAVAKDGGSGMGPLEQVIAECKKSQFRVNVVGNSAVFGRRRGTSTTSMKTDSRR